MISDIVKSLILISAVILVSSCRTGNNNKAAAPAPDKDEMADLNRYLVQKDREIIQNYIERKNLDMKETPTGLWYMIISPGSGDQLRDNDRISMNYECYLLDGTRCYSSDSLGPRDIVIGRTQVEQGLNEGLKLMKPGGKALFIIPPYLGYGLLGDRNKIPPRAIIVYMVTLDKSKGK